MLKLILEWFNFCFRPWESKHVRNNPPTCTRPPHRTEHRKRPFKTQVWGPRTQRKRKQMVLGQEAISTNYTVRKNPTEPHNPADLAEQVSRPRWLEFCSRVSQSSWNRNQVPCVSATQTPVHKKGSISWNNENPRKYKKFSTDFQSWHWAENQQILSIVRGKNLLNTQGNQEDPKWATSQKQGESSLRKKRPLCTRVEVI